MGKFFEEGGWGMYPTIIFGFLLVASAVFTVLRPERRWWLVVALGTAVWGSGLLGATMGIINTMKYVAGMAEGEQLKVLATGIAESLNNLILALVILVPTALVSAVGAVRAMRAPAGTVPR